MNRPLRFQIISFAAIRTVVNSMHRMVYPFLAVFSRGLGVELESISLALTARSIFGMFGPFLAAFADRRGRKMGLLFGIGLFTVGVSIVVFWPTFTGFVLALILATLGKYGFDPSMQAYLGDRIPYERRGRALAVTELGWSLAFIGGVPLLGLLISRSGWLSPFWVLTLLGILSILLIGRTIPPDADFNAAQPTIRSNFRLVIRTPLALMGLAVGVLISAANEVINLVFGLWMEADFGLKILALGGAAAVIGFAELGGEAASGIFVDRLGKPRAVGLGILLNSLIALVFPFLGQTLPGALIGLFLFYISFEFTLVCLIPLMTELLPAARATLMAFNVAGLSLGRALGALVAVRLFAGWGIWASAGAALVFNLLALLALRPLRVGEREGEL